MQQTLSTALSLRAAGVACERGAVDAERANQMLRLFLKNRWQGLWPILYGQQVRETALDHWIFQGFLDLDHLPEPLAETSEDVADGLRVGEAQPEGIHHV